MTERQARRAARFAAMSDEEAERARYDTDLNRMTGELGDVAYMKANSLCFAWEEQERRKTARTPK